jgi:hypothetical protein
MLAGFELSPTVPLVRSERITIIRRGQLTSAAAIIAPVQESPQMLVDRDRLGAAVPECE